MPLNRNKTSAIRAFRSFTFDAFSGYTLAATLLLKKLALLKYLENEI